MKMVIRLLSSFGVLAIFPTNLAPTANPADEVNLAGLPSGPVIEWQVPVLTSSRPYSREEKFRFASGTTVRRPPSCTGRGMVWRVLKREEQLGIVFVGCDNCNAYTGDVECSSSRDLLCVKLEKLPRPAYDVTCEGESKEPAYYCGWSGGTFAAVKGVRGCALSSRGEGNKLCQNEFGDGWKMMEFSDSWYTSEMSSEINVGRNFPFADRGGWNSFGFSQLADSDKDYWVAIDSQRANCWDFRL